MKKFYISPSVSLFETGVEAGFCVTETEGTNAWLNTEYKGYYDEEDYI